MGIPGGANLLLAAGGVSRYEIDQSLRFDGSSYLSKTFSSSGNRETNTLSLWCKRSFLAAFGDNNFTLVTADPNNNYDEIGFTQNYGNTESDEVWYRIQGGYYVIPNGLFRDVSAWTHLVFRRDGTQSTAANRLRIYVNGAEATYRATNYQPQNQVWGKLCHSCNHRIGTYDNTYQKFKGYMAELHLVDGQSLGPDSFGEYDENGVWRPIAYEGTYGTNGIYMKFDPSASNGIGHDHSGNGHHFTATGFTTSGTGTDVMSDTPTNNWCTLNPLNSYNNNTSNGNLSYSQTNSYNAVSQGTIGMPSGKWYWEINATSVGNGVYGITHYDYPVQAVYGCSNGYGTGFSPALNTAYINSSTGSSSYCSSPSAPTSGTYMFAFDADARKFWMGVNGTWYTKTGGSAGNPGAGTNELFGTSDITAGVVYRALIGGSSVTTVSGDINFGQRAFAYTPPSGFKALNTSNLPAPDIADGTKYFNTVLYTGNGSSTRAITGVGFSPDFVWIKTRSNNDNHNLYDAVRGATKFMMTNSTAAEDTNAATLKSFDSDGFTVGDTALVNWNGWTYAAWCWDAGGSGSSNTSGSITSTVSANPTAGFSIVSYTGTGNAATVGHGLGVAPSMIIEKNRDRDQNWAVYHSAIGATKALILDGTYSEQTATYYWNDTAPTSTVFSVGTWNGVNSSSEDHIAYCFAEVEGYSKIGSYTGNGSDDGAFIHLGFKPKWLLLKSASGFADDWIIMDVDRSPYNVMNDHIVVQQSSAEVSNSTETNMDFLSNGIKLRDSNGKINYSGATYIYAAFAENPFGGSGVSPATAR